MKKYILPILVSIVLPSCVATRPPVKKTSEWPDQKTERKEEKRPEEKRVEHKTEPTQNKVIPARQKVLIGIRIDADKATIQCEGGLALQGANGKAQEPGVHPVTISVRHGRIVANGITYGQKLAIAPADKTSFIEMGPKRYRGNLIVATTAGGHFNIINELGIDDYLKGVLPREASEKWPIESLKAQAVASRTYLAAHLGSHRAQGFDLCSDVHCQVYGGTIKESEKCSRAVDETKSEILVYQNKPIGAFFHSNCGGMTEEINAVWGQPDVAYLPRKKCEFGTGDPRYHWSLTLTDEVIMAALLKAGRVKGERFHTMSVKSWSPSGRAQTVSVQTDAGRFTMRGNDFRIALNPEKIRSTLWTRVDREDGGYHFEGMGWGHGIGMCQWGAKGMAERGEDYRAILFFYYPHTTLQLWNRL